MLRILNDGRKMANVMILRTMMPIILMEEIAAQKMLSNNIALIVVVKVTSFTSSHHSIHFDIY